MKIILLVLFACVGLVYANTEKLILHARSKDLAYCDPHFDGLSKVQQAPVLSPPYSEIQNQLIPRTDFQWYQLNNVQDGSNYEIRISYPAITPADFQLRMVRSCKNKDDTLSYTLQVSAEYTGISQIPQMALQPVTYDLVLETLYLGFLFYQVYKIVIAIVAVLCLGQFVLLPFIRDSVIKKTVKME